MITLEVYLGHLKSMFSALQADLDGERYKLEYAETLHFTPTHPGSKIRNDYQRVLCTTKTLSLGLLTQIDIFNALLESKGFNPQEYVNENLSKFDKNITGNLRLIQHFIEIEYAKANRRLKQVNFYIKCSPIQIAKLRIEKPSLELKVATCYNWAAKLEELWDLCTLRGYTDKDIEELNEIIINFGEFKKRENNNASH